MSEPKDEPTQTSMHSSQPFFSWLLQQELVGQIPMLELDLEEASDLAEEQQPHRDPVPVA